MPLRGRQGFTLMESLIASAILFAGVLAVISAITSGQKKAFEAEQQVVATLAAEELMGAIIADDYYTVQSSWEGYRLIEGFLAIIDVADHTEDLVDVGVVLHGQTVNLKICPSMTDMRVIVELEHFIPEPQS
jgi:Tfp pilus assembly protein PilV